ncbi:hypothetical protein [Marinobacterium jannaschii]|nr:hypothetical protein [Marinobacterium jannaschii]
MKNGFVNSLEYLFNEEAEVASPQLVSNENSGASVIAGSGIK